MKKEDNEAYTKPCDGALKITITDGDYTLREGIDYITYDCRGTSEIAWLMVMVGIGRYENIFFRGHELRVSSEETSPWSREDAESFRELF